MIKTQYPMNSNLRKYGFTLLEIVIALAIIAGGLVAVFALFPSALKLLTDSAADANISNLARTELSRVRVSGALSTGLNLWLKDTAFQMIETTASAYELYQHYGASASRVPSGKDLYRVTFKVRLNDGREERFVTYVTEQ
ncbi:MAG TPA: prepilin-type N-terminal cleavage/methylation domain-containing protein [Candidatus Hydrogenedens sp.]|nr:prepilin-type N-terminal cleavage/methylation domain-containing protein [Candidatus Hydrogenedens sp.]HOK08410.1 prepilin-type N-terminal cleavage/methylation domain-containing protein [Candidatus Hydrogenedens sp.]HOL19441.1 prepilin-type N-terminal cleavage/methylation domain-containing protein [Candidatus Hydrogenedens sp.]HPP58177.1 prepilin-type N-terminal cleavage/methylation domain-containing protein [Candidatus Hydrogenedens sp.]